MQVIEPPWSDADVDALRQRNAERVRVAIEQLGPAWVLYKRPVSLDGWDVRIDRTVPDHWVAVFTSKRA